ncbi:MAG: hypothetical protein U0871_15180 [Gemmataceae bacterium]
MSRPFPALLLLAVAAGPLLAQQPPAARLTIPAAARLLPYVSDENFAKELKLTPEQVKTLTDHRQKQWDEQYTTPTDKYAEGTAGRNKATAELFQKMLTADQHKRATQLAMQTVLSSGFTGRRLSGSPDGADGKIDPTRVSVFALRGFPELTRPLNLTDEQKKLVEARVAGTISTVPVVFLTAEQAKVVSEMIGEPAKLNWLAATDERMNRSFARGLSTTVTTAALLRMTQARDVRAELNLTEEQTKALADLAAKSQAGVQADRTLSPEARMKAQEERRAETDKALAAALKPEQLTRLKQIAMQTSTGRGRGFGDVETPDPLSIKLNDREIRKALAVSDAQVKSFADADVALANAVEKAVLSDVPVDDAIKAIEAARAAREKAYAAAVSAEQTKKLDDLLGKPFTGSTTTDRPFGRPGGPQAPPTVLNMRNATFGKRTVVELRLLASNQAIQTELGLKPEQVKAITAKNSEAASKYGPGIRANQDLAALEKSTSEQAEFVEKALADIFTTEQQKRWRELLVQRMEFFASRSSAAVSIGAVAAPGVAEAVKLTAEQKKKLLDEGIEQNKVLTAEQKAKIMELAGKKYDGNFTVGLTGRGSAGFTRQIARPTTAVVLREVPPSVFKITPEQADKLVAVMNRFQLETLPEPEVPVQGQAGGMYAPRVDPAKLATANEALAKSVATILTAEQLARIEQVKYQAVAQTAGVTLFSQADVAKALALTKEQTDKNAALVADAQRLSSAAGLPLSLRVFNSGIMSWRDKFSEKVTAKVTALLTDEQKATWKKLTGEPVPNLPLTLTTPTFGGGGLGGF